MNVGEFWALVAGLSVFLIALMVAVLVSDFGASRGLFEYHNARSKSEYAGDYYCSARDSIGTKGPAAENTKGTAKEDSENQRYSLCQQWRMAEAAEDAAVYAGRQYILGLLGTFFLFLTTVAAGLAAFWAKGAVDAGNKMNVIASGASERELRPYVGVTRVEPYVIPFEPAKLGLIGRNRSLLDIAGIRIWLNNIGKMPAEQVHVRITTVITEHVGLLASELHFEDIVPANYLSVDQQRIRAEPDAGTEFENFHQKVRDVFPETTADKLRINCIMFVTFHDEFTREQGAEHRQSPTFEFGGMFEDNELRLWSRKDSSQPLSQPSRET